MAERNLAINRKRISERNRGSGSGLGTRCIAHGAGLTPNKSNSVRRSVAFAKRSCCVSECVRACLRASARERNTENFELFAPPSPPPPPRPLSSSFFASALGARSPPFFLFPSRTPSPEAKEARVPLRLTFSGMNYFARQVAGRLRKNTTGRFVESVTCCLRSPKWRNLSYRVLPPARGGRRVLWSRWKFAFALSESRGRTDTPRRVDTLSLVIAGNRWIDRSTSRDPCKLGVRSFRDRIYSASMWNTIQPSSLRPYTRNNVQFRELPGGNRNVSLPRFVEQGLTSQETVGIYTFGRTYWYVKFRFFTRCFVRSSLNSKTDPPERQVVCNNRYRQCGLIENEWTLIEGEEERGTRKFP